MNWFNRRRIRRLKRHLDNDLPVFHPNSGNYWLYPNLTYSAANRLPSQLVRLLPNSTTSVEDASKFAADDNGQLAALFDAHGSDKAAHGYASVYSFVFRSLGRPDLALLEIGLGTNDPNAISTMGTTGRPGASLRAFRDYMPKAAIYGADIDRNILFSEQRINTGWVDQTKPATFDEMAAQLGCPLFDLIIDDGLHSSEANLNTIDFWLRSSTPGSWVVIEDIAERSLDIWHTAAALLALSGHRCRLIRTRDSYLFLANRGS